MNRGYSGVNWHTDRWKNYPPGNSLEAFQKGSQSLKWEKETEDGCLRPHKLGKLEGGVAEPDDGDDGSGECLVSSDAPVHTRHSQETSQGYEGRKNC